MPRKTSRTTGRGRSIKTRATAKKKNINDYVEKLPSPRKGDTSLARVPLPAYNTKSYYKGYKRPSPFEGGVGSGRLVPLVAKYRKPPKRRSPNLRTEEEGWGARRVDVTPIPPASRWVKRNGKRVLAFKSPVKRRRPRYDI